MIPRAMHRRCPLGFPLRGRRVVSAAWLRMRIVMLSGLATTALAAVDPADPVQAAAAAGPVAVAPVPVGYTRAYAAQIPHDAVTILSAPAAWDLRDWAIAAGIIGATAVVMTQDQHIADWSQEHRTSTTDQLAHLVKPFGSYYLVGILGGFGLASAFSDDPRVTRTALLGTESVAFAMVGYEALQLTANRPRPSQGADAGTWNGPRGPRADSFPSGHATAAFAVASVVAEEWQAVPGVAVAAYGLAGLVGVSRITDNAHWASDVVAGAVLGWASGHAVEWLHRSQQLSVAPVLGSRTRGVALCWRF